MLGARENSRNDDITHANQFYQQASQKRRNFKNVVKAFEIWSRRKRLAGQKYEGTLNSCTNY